jgi:hypothetical protein
MNNKNSDGLKKIITSIMASGIIAFSSGCISPPPGPIHYPHHHRFVNNSSLVIYHPVVVREYRISPVHYHPCPVYFNSRRDVWQHSRNMNPSLQEHHYNGFRR